MDQPRVSLYQSIRAQQQLLPQGQPDRLGGFEVDDQFERRRLLDRQSPGCAPLSILST